jgi:hypothetical protein
VGDDAVSAKFSGSLTRCLAYLGAALFIGVSAAQNISHGYSLGLARSELAGMIFAAGSLAGALMGPISFLASWNAFRNWRIGSGLVALLLGCVCVIYAITSSLGFVGTSKDSATATRAADADAYKIAKASAEAASTELKALAGLARADRKTEAKRAERRTALEAKVAEAQKVMAANAGTGAADPTAAAITSYAGALGWKIEADKISPWLTLLAVLFFEVGAAASLIVVAALPGAETVPREPAAPPAKARGRKRTAPLEDVMAKLKGAGGKLEGSMDQIGTRLGLTKSSAHRALHAMAGAGMISLATSAAGTLVQVRPTILAG